MHNIFISSNMVKLKYSVPFIFYKSLVIHVNRFWKIKSNRISKWKENYNK